MSSNTSWIPHGRIRLTLLLVSFLSASAEYANAQDFCVWAGKPSNTYFTLELRDPVLLIDERVSVGSVMLRKTLHSSAPDLGTLTCSVAPNLHRYTLYGLTSVQGYSGVYESGIEGIGLRIYSGGASGGVSNGGILPDYDNSVYNAYRPRKTFELQLVRTGQRVGSGTIALNFSVSMSSRTASDGPYRRMSWEAVGSATVINEAMYASCEPVKSVETVDMGEVQGGDLQAGRAPVKAFSVDVQCKGLDRPNNRVSAYFEGNSPRVGILDIQTGEGQARGVALALKDAQDNLLKFGQSNLYKLPLVEEGADAHVYRFEGSAQYIRTGGPLQTGPADAALTYVLDYN